MQHKGRYWIVIWILVLCCIVLGGAVDSYVYCPVKRWVGIPCPGCGGFRAVRELAHGHILQAFYYNPLTTFLIFCTFLWGVLWGIDRIFRTAFCRKISSVLSSFFSASRKAYGLTVLIFLLLLNWVWLFVNGI